MMTNLCVAPDVSLVPQGCSCRAGRAELARGGAGEMLDLHLSAFPVLDGDAELPVLLPGWDGAQAVPGGLSSAVG